MKKVWNWFIDVFKGIAIGFAAMIPGVSGGTMAILTKCYDKLINNVASLFKTFVKSFLILLPLGVGVLLGVALGYFSLRLAFQYILFIIVSLFFGLILGSIPDIAKEVKGEKAKPSYIITFVIAFLVVFGIALAAFLISLGTGYEVDELFINPQWYLYVIMLPLGMLASIALVAPGISGSMLLLVLGFYQPLLNTIHEAVHFNNFGQNVGLLACFLVGIIVGFFLISKLMKFLLEKHRIITFYGILGFIIGSLPALYLNNDIWFGEEGGYVGIANHIWEFPVGIVILIGAAVGTFFLLRYVSKRREEKVEEENA